MFLLKNNTIKTKSLLFVITSLFFCSFIANAANYTTARDGHWINPFTWENYKAPGTQVTHNDNVLVKHAINTTNIKITNGGKLTIADGGTLDVQDIEFLGSNGIVEVKDGGTLIIESINGQPVNETNLPANVTKTGTGQINPKPLPVNLVYFNAAATATSIALEFATTEEVNNDFIAIERSSDASNFETINIQKGTNSKSLSIYKFTDYNPLAGNNYYRLRQVDTDGTTTYSKIVIASNNKLDLTVHKDLNFTTSVSGSVHILDTNANTVYKASLHNTHTLELPQLPQGLYIIRAAVNNQLITKKVIL